MSAANDIVEDEFDFEAEDAEYEDGNAQLGQCAFSAMKTHSSVRN